MQYSLYVIGRRRAWRGALCRAVALCLIPLAGLAPRLTAADSTLTLASFAPGPGKWQRRTWTPAGTAQMAALEAAPAPQGQGTWLRLPVEFPARSEFVAPVETSWQGWQELVFRVVLPDGLPARTFLCLFTKDRDHLWRQVRRPAPLARGTPVEIVVPIAGPAAGETWTPCGHERPWHPLTPAHLAEYGLGIEPDTGLVDRFTGDAFLVDVTLRRQGIVHPENPVRDLQFAPRAPRVGERFEVTFRLGDDYRDPFSPDSVKVEAVVTPPGGAAETVRGFYYEGFLYHPQESDITRTLSPYGAPCFKVRYCPRSPGRHAVRITATVEGRVLPLPELSFLALPAEADYRGFVRRDPKYPPFLMWEDGTHFWSLGLNVRSPFDTRYIQVVPYSRWQDEGLALYDRLFAKYRENGIKVVEVWMSSWWLALEWINDAPGFHGVGYYNPYRAWMLDHIMEQAEKHGLYVILVLNNHGKFGALNDTEWARNPYNRANGGFLDSCEDYFTDPRARAAFRQTCDYIVARWGASPHLMMWKLFSEVDLTGTSYEFYTQPQVAEWHREMGGYLKRIDIYQHLTTTHWMLSYQRINAAIAQLPELDVLTTDAYYQGGGTAQLLAMLRSGSGFATQQQKPLLITEYGGSPHADSMGNLVKQAHLGIWTGFFNEAPSAPMFWWFALVDEKGLYPFYTALTRFSANEDRRGLVPSQREIAGKGLVVSELRGSDRLIAWGFDPSYYLTDDENITPTRYSDVVFEAAPLPAGTYTVEVWDVGAGQPCETRPLTVADATAPLRVPMPPFARDFALKILPRTP